MNLKIKIDLKNKKQNIINQLSDSKNFSAKIILKNCIKKKKQFLIAEKIQNKKKDIIRLLNSNSNEKLSHIFNEIDGAYAFIEISEDSITIQNDFFSRVDIFFKYDKENNLIYISNSFDFFYSERQNFNQKALLHYFLNYGSRPPKKNTVFKDVNRLDNSQYISINLKNKTLKTNYLNYKKILKTPVNKNNFNDLFLECLKRKSDPDLNIVYLSSGWDSTAVLGGLIYLYGKKKVKAVTSIAKHDNRAGVHNKFEVDRAKKIAKYFDVDHYFFKTDYSSNGVYNKINEAKKFSLKYHLFNIVPISHYLISNYVKKKFGEGVTAFSGEYSDGLNNLGFSQNLSIFHKDSFGFREYSDKMRTYLYTSTFIKTILDGSYVKDPIYKIFLNYFPSLKKSKFNNIDEVAQDILQNLFLNPTRMPLSKFKKNKFVNDKGVKEYIDYMRKEYLYKNEKNFDKNYPFKTYLQLYKSFHWQCSTVAGIELAGIENKINNQIAFQDRKLFDYFAFLPNNFGRDLEINNTKFVIKNFLSEKIKFPMDLGAGPHSYTYDTDPSFSILSQLINFSGFKNNFRNNLKKANIDNFLDKSYFKINDLRSIKNKYLNKKIVIGEELDVLSKMIELSNFICSLDYEKFKK